MQRDLADISFTEKGLAIISPLDGKNAMLRERFFSGEHQGWERWAEIIGGVGEQPSRAHPYRRLGQLDDHFALFWGRGEQKAHRCPKHSVGYVFDCRRGFEPGVSQFRAAIGSNLIQSRQPFVVDQDPAEHAVVAPIRSATIHIRYRGG